METRQLIYEKCFRRVPMIGRLALGFFSEKTAKYRLFFQHSNFGFYTDELPKSTPRACPGLPIQGALGGRVLPSATPRAHVVRPRGP